MGLLRLDASLSAGGLSICPKHVVNAPFTTAVAASQGSCQSAAMTAPRSKPRQAGGILLALGFTIGAIVGVILGEPSAGFLVGGALGCALALLMWWRDR
jgi:hypothetical protein